MNGSMTTKVVPFNDEREKRVEKDCQRYTRDALELYTKTRVFKAMKPLIIALSICGMHFCKEYGPVTECAKKVEDRKSGKICMKRKKTQRKIHPSEIYCFLLFTILLANFIRMLSMFTIGTLSFDSELLFKLCVSTWHALLLFNMISLLRASCRYESIPKFFIEYENLLEITGWKCTENERKFALISTIIAVFMTGVCTCLFYIAVFKSPILVEPMLAPFQVSDANSIIIERTLLVLSPLLNSAWIMPVAVDFMFCYCLYRLFAAWGVDFNAKVASCQMNNEEFRKQREIHQRICHLVSDADDFLSLYKAMNFLCNIGIILFILFSLIYAPEDVGDRATYVGVNMCWMTFTIFILLMTCISGAMVNHVVRTESTQIR